MIDADTILRSLRTADLPVTGVTIRDPADPATWTFTPATLTTAEIAQATRLVQTLIATATQPPIPVTLGPTLDQVIAWQAGKLGIPAAQARAEIALLPLVYTPPVVPPTLV